MMAQKKTQCLFMMSWHNGRKFRQQDRRVVGQNREPVAGASSTWTRVFSSGETRSVFLSSAYPLYIDLL